MAYNGPTTAIQPGYNPIYNRPYNPTQTPLDYGGAFCVMLGLHFPFSIMRFLATLITGAAIAAAFPMAFTVDTYCGANAPSFNVVRETENNRYAADDAQRQYCKVADRALELYGRSVLR